MRYSPKEGIQDIYKGSNIQLSEVPIMSYFFEINKTNFLLLINTVVHIVKYIQKSERRSLYDLLFDEAIRMMYFDAILAILQFSFVAIVHILVWNVIIINF